MTVKSLPAIDWNSQVLLTTAGATAVFCGSSVRIWQPKTVRTSAIDISVACYCPLPAIFSSAFLVTPVMMQSAILLASFTLWVTPGARQVPCWQLTYKLVMARSCWPSIAHHVALSISSQIVTDKHGPARGLPRHSTAAAPGTQWSSSCATDFIHLFPTARGEAVDPCKEYC